MPEKKNILILCSRLDLPGGIERAIVNTANRFQENGHAVTILVLDINANLFYPLNDGVVLFHLALHFGITKKGNPLSRKLDFLKHISRLREKIKTVAPQVILSTEYPFTIAATIAMRNSPAKVFAWEHHHFYHLPKSSFWQLLYKRFYPKATSVICLNEDEARLYKTMGCRTEVIPNFIERKKKASLADKTILTVGWLSKTKGIDMLPAIAQKVFDRHPDWNWKIIGSGDEENWLKDELQKQGLDRNVSVVSPVSYQLDEEYLSASMYVMTSRFECFPMVLLEAMSHGLPCIAFDCPTGPKHIITDNENGVLVPPGDQDCMAEAIINLICNEETRTQLGEKAYESVQRFSPEKLYAVWQRILVE